MTTDGDASTFAAGRVVLALLVAGKTLLSLCMMYVYCNRVGICRSAVGQNSECPTLQTCTSIACYNKLLQLCSLTARSSEL